MARLYELFVAEWLKKHLPQQYFIQPQEKVDVGENNELSFEIDLVLYEAASGKAVCVLDTKYKAVESPSNRDVEQVVTYAQIKECKKAVLIYPIPLCSPLNTPIGGIRVFSKVFSLEGDLEAAGQKFLDDLLACLEQ